MITLAELQDRISGDDEADALAAALELSRIQVIYLSAKNALADELAVLEIAVDLARNGRGGVDQALVSRLESAILDVHGRIADLDQRLRAFRQTGAFIRPPSAAAVEKVRQLAEEVARLKARDDALERIAAATIDIGKIVNGA